MQVSINLCVVKSWNYDEKLWTRYIKLQVCQENKSVLMLGLGSSPSYLTIGLSLFSSLYMNRLQAIQSIMMQKKYYLYYGI